jgi:hypothetical protein
MRKYWAIILRVVIYTAYFYPRPAGEIVELASTLEQTSQQPVSQNAPPKQVQAKPVESLVNLVTQAAVNMRQCRRLENRVDKAYSSIASVAVLVAIPDPAPGKSVSVGVGVGNFENRSAMAVDGEALVGDQKNIILTAGVGYCENTTTINAGLGWSF